MSAAARNKLVQLAYFLVSFILVASAQPDWSVAGCVLASCLGYALFWQGASYCTSRRSRFGWAVLWFGGISAFHLNWFFADRYMGAYIYAFNAFLFTWLGVQFALATLLIGNPRELNGLQMLGLSGGWAFCEWCRLFLLSGYSLDPMGIALSGTLPGMQMASLLGIYGLSFWVFFTNLVAFRALSSFSKRGGFVWIVLAATPYLFGSVQLALHSPQLARGSSINTLLVQTALMPEDKVRVNGSKPFSPVDQWRNILTLLAPHLSRPLDLIVLPEGAVPYGTHYPIYESAAVKQVFKEILGSEPPLGDEKVGNRAWVQSLADLSGVDVILGLEDVDVQREQGTFQAYNAAFLARPHHDQLMRYEKRVLVPMGEYIPFDWCKKILSKYGIMDSYTPGKEAKIFPTTPAPAGLSICYEETYGYLMRQSRLKGAQMLINLTNDVWFPSSRLPVVHFFHGRLRAVELGVPLLRACNTGVTCAVDSLGRIVGQLPSENAHQASSAAVLAAPLPVYHYPTLYTRFGDALTIGGSILLFALFLVSKLFKIKQFAIKAFNFYPLRKN